MIMDELKYAQRYGSLSPVFRDAFAELERISSSQPQPGKYELAEGRFVVVQSYDTKAPDQGVWEAHRAYIDIQYVEEGEEQIGYAPLAHLDPLGEYDPEKDFQGFKGKGTMLRVKKGCFCVFWPEDVHMPGLGKTSTSVKKLVLKIPVSSLEQTHEKTHKRFS